MKRFKLAVENQRQRAGSLSGQRLIEPDEVYSWSSHFQTLLTTVMPATDTAQLAKQGRSRYQSGPFARAIAVWQQAAAAFDIKNPNAIVDIHEVIKACTPLLAMLTIVFHPLVSVSKAADGFALA